ncbi:MAG TPA: TetR/AcrR family transcriptional regulator [Ferruginibacter sp.]|jgi:AcrR family transcriptional regulator|nr:TetR/AcrR family transcriptional regulator [Ferruginibacter sp.]
MERKEIQEQRMKGYFIEATKDILKGEGLKNISVRNIAERAGYSFATLYNYFKDVKELIFFCVKDFQTECETHVKERTDKVARGSKKLKAITKAYLEYFIQYPGIFELFFIEKLSDISGNQEASALIVSFLDRLCDEEWDYCIKNKLITEKDAGRIKATLLHTTTGILLLYLHRRSPKDYTDYMKLVSTQVDHILNEVA